MTRLVGGGKTELCKLLFGEGNIDTGEVTFQDKTLSLKSPSDAVTAGIAMSKTFLANWGITYNSKSLSSICL